MVGPVELPPTFPSPVHDARLAQHREVLGDCRKRDVEVRRNIAGGAFLVPHETQHFAPDWVADGFEGIHANSLAFT